jgi:hypothetical protein
MFKGKGRVTFIENDQQDLSEGNELRCPILCKKRSR